MLTHSFKFLHDPVTLLQLPFLFLSLLYTPVSTRMSRQGRTCAPAQRSHEAPSSSLCSRRASSPAEAIVSPAGVLSGTEEGARERLQLSVQSIAQPWRTLLGLSDKLSSFPSSSLSLSANPTLQIKAGVQLSQREHMSPSSWGAFAHCFPVAGAEHSGSEQQTLLVPSANTVTEAELSCPIELWRHLPLLRVLAFLCFGDAELESALLTPRSCCSSPGQVRRVCFPHRWRILASCRLGFRFSLLGTWRHNRASALSLRF